MWYYEHNDQQSGPVSKEQIIELLNSGQISASSLVWKDGMPEWVALGQVGEFQAVSTIENDLSTPASSPYEAPKTPVTRVPTMHGGSRQNVCALLSMIFGIGGAVCVLSCCLIYFAILLSPAAVVLGHIARHQMKKSEEPQTGAGLALTGLILGYIFFVITIVILGFGFGAMILEETGSFDGSGF